VNKEPQVESRAREGRAQLRRVNAGVGEIEVGSNDENQHESQLGGETGDDTEAD
jgi:hypothetical protein